MKKIVGFTLLILCMWSGGDVTAQNYEGGIRSVDIGNGLPTYEIKLVSLPNETLGDRLENAFMQKEGFVSAESSAANQTITVVALQAFRKKELNDVVDYAGFEVAKSFDQ